MNDLLAPPVFLPALATLAPSPRALPEIARAVRWRHLRSPALRAAAHEVGLDISSVVVGGGAMGALAGMFVGLIIARTLGIEPGLFPPLGAGAGSVAGLAIAYFTSFRECVAIAALRASLWEVPIESLAALKEAREFRDCPETQDFLIAFQEERTDLAQREMAPTVGQLLAGCQENAASGGADKL